MKIPRPVLVLAVLTVLSGCGSPSNAGSSAHSAPTMTLFEKAVDFCGLKTNPGASIGDGGHSITLDNKGTEDTSGLTIKRIVCVLAIVDVPDSVLSQMDSTSSLQGRQHAAWDDIKASWIYHPDYGLDIIMSQS